MQKLFSVLVCCLMMAFICSCKGNAAHKSIASQTVPIQAAKPKISFTFDDGITNDILNYKFEEWNEMILQSLEKAEVKSIFFVTGLNKQNKKGRFLLNTWNDRGHKIANHTFSHPNFNDENVSIDDFETELLKTDAIISEYSNYVRLFRFPYLKEGHTHVKIDGIRNILSQYNYKNGYVTIDASDWYINDRLIKKIKQKGVEKAEIEKFKAFYVEHIIDRAKYYEALSYQLNQRHISHTLLLHHNLTSALFLSDLIDTFKEEGWEIVDAETAYQDKVYDTVPSVVPAGESLIWSLAKQSGHYEQRLRYPAEDSQYEEPKMNQLGL